MMREPEITNKSEYLAAMASASAAIGTAVVKRSGKPFKSSNTQNTVVGVCINPNSRKIAYIFDEDESIVDCFRCKPATIACKKRKRSITITDKQHGDYSDYDCEVTANEQGGLEVLWNQRFEVTYGYLSGWHDHIKGTTAGTFHDDGSGINITVGDSNTIMVDYSQLSVLYAMLKYHNEHSKFEPAPLTYTIHKTK